MKATLLLLAVFSTTIFAHPAGKSPDDATPELTIIPLEKGPYGQPIIDTGIIGGDNVEVGLFDDLFRNLAGIMNRMQQQIDGLFGRNRNGTVIQNSDFPGLFVPNIDLSKGNTTSVTKKIDGHKVVINQTIYNGGDDDDGTFFNVRVVEVLPDSSEEKTDSIATTTTTATQQTINKENRDRESIENSAENEVGNSGATAVPEKLQAA